MNIRTLAIATVATAISFSAIMPASQAQAGHRKDVAIAVGAGLFSGFILGSALNEHRHGHRHNHGYGYATLPAAHVQSCFERYDSYDVRSNTWTDYSYRTRVCNSQYLY